MTHQKHRQPPCCIVKFLQILCSGCLRLILVILQLSYEKGAAVFREYQILIFFPKHSFLFFYRHKMNLLYSFIISKILVYIFNFFFFDKPLEFNRKRLSHKLCWHFWHLYTPHNKVVGGYTGFTMSVRLSFHPSVRLSIRLQTNPMSYDNLSCVSQNLFSFVVPELLDMI